MAEYDSDEDVADLDYTTTTTLLGYAEPSPSDDAVSHLGGIPTWLDDPMDSRLAKCLSCNHLMPLLLQLDGNLPESPHHTRMLYLFGCRAKSCRKQRGSIRAIRGVKATGVAQAPSKESPAKVEQSPPEEPKAKPSSNMGDMIFGGSPSSGTPTNPFASASQTNPFAKPNPFAATDGVSTLAKTFAAVASISTPEAAKPASKPNPPASDADSPSSLIGPPSPWPPAEELPQYPNFYLDASFEELEPDALTLQSQKLAKTITMDTSDDLDDAAPSRSKKAGGASKPSKESEFESAMNATFLHFQRITSQNPEQVLRYERRSAPLLYSRDDTVGKLLASSKGGDKVSLERAPRCSNCGAGRCFEMQLMPHAISVLEGADAALDEGMVWGTILVGTCELDCAVAGSASGRFVEEWVGAQWETD
ncbi:hypothetical protein DRE_05387 [Drechslerella stenobrocha 248]|uniref:Programmed cell death protein 2 C-terminal domain-containing protein n=1 Tax=Drechslerella stenobrocha 248 TaxID=1043628 RepID=W7HQU9_9PEZI|nr:hypothetical protein DRE_05387 [Drechslerella stenobrocha 248]